MFVLSNYINNHMDFNQLFNQISPEEINDSIFTLVGKDYLTITVGDENRCNSMVGSGGGLGVLFKKPVAWCVLRSDRYTLELIQEMQTYTISYFPNQHREQMLFLGSKSGKGSNKMKESGLNTIQTPLGNMSFKEARLIIECKLMQITTPEIDDFYTQEAKDYLKEAYKQASDIRKYVYGEITCVWVKK